MDDFKIIKCPKCDAPLVVMKAEIVDRCVQCGHGFGLTKKSTSTTSSQPGNQPEAFSQQSQAAALEKKPISPELKAFIERLKNKATKNTKAKKQRKVNLKKNPSRIVTWIKWYFITIIFGGILSAIFSK